MDAEFMKVLQVIDSGGLYGAERVLLALMGALRDQGVESALASISEPGMAEKAIEIEARAQQHEVWRIDMAAGPDRRAAGALLGRARKDGFSILHTHGYKANILLAGMPRSQRGLPAVATLHGWTATRWLSRMNLYETVERLVLRRADRVVAVSHAMVDRWGLRRRYGSRLAVIPNGIQAPIPASAESLLPRDLQMFVAGRSTIFAAGRLSREKGFDVLLEAIAQVRANGLNACLVLAGEGGERDALERQAARLGLKNSVAMPGYLDNAGALMSAFDVVAIPSRTEGLPLVLLEALLAGLPVAATDVGGMPEVVKACAAGECVPAEDPGSLARRLAEILNRGMSTSERNLSSEAARALYTDGAMAAQYRAIYLQEQEAA